MCKFWNLQSLACNAFDAGDDVLPCCGELHPWEYVGYKQYPIGSIYGIYLPKQPIHLPAKSTTQYTKVICQLRKFLRLATLHGWYDDKDVKDMQAVQLMIVSTWGVSCSLIMEPWRETKVIHEWIFVDFVQSREVYNINFERTFARLLQTSFSWPKKLAWIRIRQFLWRCRCVFVDLPPREESTFVGVHWERSVGLVGSYITL